MSTDKKGTAFGEDTTTKGVMVVVRARRLMNDTPEKKVRKVRTKRLPIY